MMLHAPSTTLRVSHVVRAKRVSMIKVGANQNMKGGNKYRGRKKDIWPLDSDDEMDYSASPSSYILADRMSYGSSIGGNMNWKDTMKPRNENQEHYVKLLEAANTPIVVSTGPAGCGKTLWAVVVGMRKLQSGQISKVILTRPAVSVDEEHGFLPGTLEEKMDPWIRPLYDVMYKFFTPKQIQQMIEKQIIEICPLAYMRGRTFENAWIILDESQNTLKSQMLMALTRIGYGSKLVVTGDPLQHDRGFETNGLSDLLWRLDGKNMDDIAVVRFTTGDIERHPVIHKVLKLYS